MLKKYVAILAAAILSTLGLFPLGAVPAAGATTGTLTVVTAGGAAEGSGWSYNAGLIELTASTSVNASDIEAKLALGNLTLFADEIQVNASLSFGSNDLTFKSKGSIRMPGGVTITATGGDILFQADSDDSGVGEIRLGNLTTDSGSISSGGGNITLSGGSDPLTGFAMATSSYVSPKPAAGVALFGFDLDAGGGDIVIRASSGANGTISTRSFLATSTNTSAISSIVTSGGGTVEIFGDGSAINHSNAWGVVFEGLNITTDAGDVLLQGKGRLSGNGRGLVGSGLNITSGAGEVLIQDLTDGTGFAYGGSIIGAAITTSAIATIQTDQFLAGAGLDIDALSFSMIAQTGTSFVGATSLGAIDLTGTPTATFGGASNTANLAISGALTSDGNITLNSSGAISQSSKIEAAGLALGSTGTATLTNTANDLDVIAAATTANRMGNITFVDKDDLQIGTVGSLSGISSTGVVNISTNSGDLSITQPLSSTATSSDSVLLYADKDAAAGAAGDGDIKISGSGTVSIDATSRAGLYSGTRATSTGLVTLVGEANVRTNVAGTTALGSVTPSVGSTGLFALFRSTAASAPSAPGAVSASSVAGSREATLSWSAPTVTGGAAITGYKIEIKDGNGWTTQTANTGSSATTATIPDLVIGTSYQFRVSAINSAGTSSASVASTSLTILDFPPPAPYTGPLLTNLTLLPLVAGESETVTLNGVRLDTVISATVDELKLTIVSKSESQLVILVPGLKAGIKDLVLISSSGILTHQDAFKVSETEPEVVSETVNQKVNAGSFKGYVAIYAKGYEGKRLSAKVGNDWVIVPNIANNQEDGGLFRIVEFTGAGYTINVRIFIDRVLVRTVTLTTK